MCILLAIVCLISSKPVLIYNKISFPFLTKSHSSSLAVKVYNKHKIFHSDNNRRVYTDTFQNFY